MNKSIVPTDIKVGLCMLMHGDSGEVAKSLKLTTINTLHIISAVRLRVCSLEEAHRQYGRGYAVLTKHSISTEEAHRQYRHRCAVRGKVCSTNL